MRYAVVVEKSESGFGAYVPDLPGCVPAAESHDELRKRSADTILDTADQPFDNCGSTPILRPSPYREPRDSLGWRS